MIDRGDADAIAELEAALRDLGTALAYPATPDLAQTVGARLRERSYAAARRPVWRSLPRSLVLAAAIALLAVSAVLAVRYGLQLLSVEVGPVPSPSADATATGSASASGATLPLGSGLGLGTVASLEEAEAAADFELLVPANVGAPDSVFLGGPALQGQTAFVYRAREGLPASPLLDGAGLLVTQNRGDSDKGLAHKLADAKLATVEAVDVDGAPGVWISGQPHMFWYLAPDGRAIEDSRRLVGDTLAWERDGVLYRIEGAITKAQALDIAASMR